MMSVQISAPVHKYKGLQYVHGNLVSKHSKTYLKPTASAKIGATSPLVPLQRKTTLISSRWSKKPHQFSSSKKKNTVRKMDAGSRSVESVTQSYFVFIFAVPRALSNQACGRTRATSRHPRSTRNHSSSRKFCGSKVVFGLINEAVSKGNDWTFNSFVEFWEQIWWLQCLGWAVVWPDGRPKVPWPDSQTVRGCSFPLPRATSDRLRIRLARDSTVE